MTVVTPWADSTPSTLAMVSICAWAISPRMAVAMESGSPSVAWTLMSATVPFMMPLKAVLIMSVKMSEPLTKDTPSTMAKALIRSRSLRPSKDFHEARSMAQASRPARRASTISSRCVMVSRTLSRVGRSSSLTI